MDERKLKDLVRQCEKEYYQEDKKILIDESITQITCSIYLLYNLIFFGNKVLLSEETYEKLKEISEDDCGCASKEISSRNAKFILQAIKNDGKTTYNDYTIIKMDEYGENKNERIRNFLLKNPDAIFYFCSNDLYQELNQIEIRNQLCPLKKGMVEVNPFKNRKIRFETIGIVKIQDQKMIVKRKEEILVKIFNSKGVQKYTDEVKPRDFLLIRGEKKDDKYS